PGRPVRRVPEHDATAIDPARGPAPGRRHGTLRRVRDRPPPAGGVFVLQALTTYQKMPAEEKAYWLDRKAPGRRSSSRPTPSAHPRWARGTGWVVDGPDAPRGTTACRIGSVDRGPRRIEELTRAGRSARRWS